MKHDLWLYYEECLNYGIIDDIYNGDKSNLTITPKTRKMRKCT
jgi:hypothetical protein